MKECKDNYEAGKVQIQKRLLFLAKINQIFRQGVQLTE